MKKIVSLGFVIFFGILLVGCKDSNTSNDATSKNTESSAKKLDGSYSYLFDEEDDQWIKLEIDGSDVLYTDKNGDNFTGSIDTKKQKMTFDTEDETSFSYEYKAVGNKIIIKTPDDDYILMKESDVAKPKATTKQSKEKDESSTSGNLKIKTSPDKYTHYVKNYVGRNAASCGSERLSGDMMDDYGKASLDMVFIAENGEQVTPENAKDYIVTKQYPEPNTEIKLTFDTDENREEYENLVSESTINEIELTVKPLTDD